LSIDDIVKAYPNLTKEDVKAAILYSAEILSKEEIIGF